MYSAVMAASAALVSRTSNARQSDEPVQCRRWRCCPRMMPPLFIGHGRCEFPAGDYDRRCGRNPFVLVVVTVRLQRFDIELEQASRARPRCGVALPNRAAAVAPRACSRSPSPFNEVLITNFTSAPPRCRVYIYSKLHRSIHHADAVSNASDGYPLGRVSAAAALILPQLQAAAWTRRLTTNHLHSRREQVGGGSAGAVGRGSTKRLGWSRHSTTFTSRSVRRILAGL